MLVFWLEVCSEHLVATDVNKLFAKVANLNAKISLSVFSDYGRESSLHVHILSYQVPRSMTLVGLWFLRHVHKLYDDGTINC